VERPLTHPLTDKVIQQLQNNHATTKNPEKPDNHETSDLSWSVLGHVLSKDQSKDGSDDGHLTIVQCQPPLPPATLLRLISDLHWNSSSTSIPPTNHHSYHCHYQPAPCAIYCSTIRAPPCSTHVPYCRPIILCMHQFSRSWLLAAIRTFENLSQHSSASFGVQVFSLYVPFCYHMLSFICLCLYLYKY